MNPYELHWTTIKAGLLWPNRKPHSSKGSISTCWGVQIPQEVGNGCRFRGFMSFSPRNGCWTKYRGGFPPQIIHFHRVWNHYFHHPFWGFSPYFWFNTPISGFSSPQIFLVKKVTVPSLQPWATTGCWEEWLLGTFGPIFFTRMAVEIHLRSLTASFPLKNGGKGRR